MKMLTAHQFGGMEKYRFGIDTERTASLLRDLADAVEKHEILPQEVICYSASTLEDYTMDTFVLRFAAKQDAPKNLKELHGPGSPLPVDVQPQPPGETSAIRRIELDAE